MRERTSLGSPSRKRDEEGSSTGRVVRNTSNVGRMWRLCSRRIFPAVETTTPPVSTDWQTVQPSQSEGVSVEFVSGQQVETEAARSKSQCMVHGSQTTSNKIAKKFFFQLPTSSLSAKRPERSNFIEIRGFLSVTGREEFISQ